jgi:hypothetical protein
MVFFRNLTYSAPLYVDITKTVVKEGQDPIETQHQKTFIGKRQVHSIPVPLESRMLYHYRYLRRKLGSLHSVPWRDITGFSRFLANESLRNPCLHLFLSKNPVLTTLHQRSAVRGYRLLYWYLLSYQPPHSMLPHFCSLCAIAAISTSFTNFRSISM